MTNPWMHWSPRLIPRPEPPMPAITYGDIIEMMEKVRQYSPPAVPNWIRTHCSQCMLDLATAANGGVDPTKPPIYDGAGQAIAQLFGIPVFYETWMPTGYALMLDHENKPMLLQFAQHRTEDGD